MLTITATQWLVLDNLKNGWYYRNNICDYDAADEAYRWCVENEYVRDGKITEEGKVALMASKIIKKSS